MIIQNYFPGVERHAGDIDVPRGQFRSFTTPPSQNPCPSPVGGFTLTGALTKEVSVPHM